MTKLTIGIVDYGVGNHASVRQCLHHLGLRCRVSDDPLVLDACDLLLLPGVGAFRLAMQALQTRSLDRFVTDQARQQKPILGICLGMQLLTEASHENGYTTGLGLIPGETIPLGPLRWHIGWNTVEQVREDPLFQHGSSEAFFFNHSYVYQGPEEFQVCKTRSGDAFASIIRREKVVGVQFHPEKSQDAGHVLLRQIVVGLCDA
jgi:glutamine amidotransferase